MAAPYLLTGDLEIIGDLITIKIGWIKEGEHEFVYNNNNYLWSTVWDDSFLSDEQFKLFEEWVLKFGYRDVKTSIFNEVPSVLDLDFVKNYFNVKVSMLSVWKDLPQLYIMILGQRLEKIKCLI